MSLRTKTILISLFFTIIFMAVDFAFAQTPTSNCTNNNTVWGNIVCTQGVRTVWQVSLALVDFIVVAGLIVAAFANIFRFKIDTYSVKQILPGLIIGIILANLSFFIMRLMLESATIFTQFIGNIVASFTGDNIGGSQVGPFLMESARELLFKSLFVIPGWTWAQNLVGAGATAGIAAAAFFGSLAVALTAAAGGAVLLLFLLFLFMLLPMVLILILVFLLYIRNYVLIFLFMISPIAFFALGFPPMKKVWQTWWGTFWKWLLMPIVAFGIVGLMVIFLNAANIPEPGTIRNPLDYFFFNGLAIVMLFMANRIPFMWGSVLGFNAMQKWAGLGSSGANLAGRGIKVGADKLYEGNAGKLAGLIRPIRNSRLANNRFFSYGLAGKTGSALDEVGRRAGVKRNPGEEDDDYRNRIERQQVSTWNPIRGISGARQGIKARMEFWEADAARKGRRTGYFPNLAGNEAAVRFYLQDNREVYSNIESLAQAEEALGDIVQMRFSQKELDDIRKLSPTQLAALRLNPPPGSRFGELSQQEIANLYLALGRVQTLGRQRSASVSSGAQLITNAMTELYQPGRAPLGTPPLAAGAEWKHGDPLRPFDQRYFDDFRKRAPYGGDEIGNGEEETGNGGGNIPLPPSGGRPTGGGENQTARPEVNAVSTAAHHQTLQSLVTAAEEQYNIPVPTLDKIIRRVRRRIDARPGSRALGSQPQERVTFEDVSSELRQEGVPELSRDQWKAALPQLSAYSQNRRSLAQSLDRGEGTSSGRFEQLSSASALAKTIAQNQPTQLPELQEKMRQYAAELSQANQPSLERLREVQADLAKIQPQLQISTSQASPETLRETLRQSAEQSRDAISLLQNETTQAALQSGADVNNALKQTIRTEQLKDNVTVNVTGSVESVIKQKGGTLDAQDIQSIASKIVPDMQTLADFHPDLQKIYGLSSTQQQEILNQAATEFVQHVVEQVQNLPQGASAIEHVVQPDQRESLNQHLTSLVKSKIESTPTAQSSAPQSAPPSPDESTSPPPDSSSGNNP